MIHILRVQTRYHQLVQEDIYVEKRTLTSPFDEIVEEIFIFLKIITHIYIYFFTYKSFLIKFEGVHKFIAIIV